MKCDELKAYELMDGAYGMYLAIDGFGVDVDLGSFFYPKEEVDQHIKELQRRLNKVNKHLKDLRQKYRAMSSSHADAVKLCRDLAHILEVTK